ncbi:MAG: hypothetical protein R2942_06365 [Ignavibacteria bacterium]
MKLLNGKDALEKIAEHKDIDILLSDINMPEMDYLYITSATQARNQPVN